MMSLINHVPVDDRRGDSRFRLDEVVEFNLCHIFLHTDIVQNILQINGHSSLRAIVIGDVQLHGLGGGVNDVDDADGAGVGGNRLPLQFFILTIIRGIGKREG